MIAYVAIWKPNDLFNIKWIVLRRNFDGIGDDSVIGVQTDGTHISGPSWIGAARPAVIEVGNVLPRDCNVFVAFAKFVVLAFPIRHDTSLRKQDRSRGLRNGSGMFANEKRSLGAPGR